MRPVHRLSLTRTTARAPRALLGLVLAALFVLLACPPALAQGGARGGRKGRDAAAEASVAAQVVDAAADAEPQDAEADVHQARADGSTTAPPAASRAAPLPEWAGSPVRVRNATVFTVRVPLGGRTPEQRAKAASQALDKVVEANETNHVHVEPQGDLWAVYVGDRPIIELGPDDAAAAGDASPNVHAQTIAVKIGDSLNAEQRRHSLLTMGLSLLGAAVAGLFALYLGLRIGRIARRSSKWMQDHPDRIPSLRVQTIAVIRPATLRILLTGSIRLLTIFAQIAIAYGWLLLSLYLFEPTRGYTEKLTDLVLSPISAAMTKVAGSLPVAAVAVLSIAALVVLLRFVGLYFGSAARGETTISWLSPDLIRPTSLAVRFGIVVLFLVVLLPFVTGNQDGALSRVGLVVLIALGLAATPVLASSCVGIVVMYGRGLHVGDFVSFGAISGRIDAITLLEVRLTDSDGSEVRVPHLFSIFTPTKVLGRLRPVTATLSIGAGAAHEVLRKLFADVAAKVGVNPRVELLSFDAEGASYRVCVYSDLPDAQHRLLTALADAIASHRIPLGTSRRGTP